MSSPAEEGCLLSAAWRGACSCQGCGRAACSWAASSEVATAPSPSWAREVLWGWICPGNPRPSRFGSHLCRGLLVWGVGRIGLLALGIQLCPEFLRRFAAGRPAQKGRWALEGTLSPGSACSPKPGACGRRCWAPPPPPMGLKATEKPGSLLLCQAGQVASWMCWFLGGYKGIGIQRLLS